MAAPSSWVKEGTAASFPKDTTWRRPDESVGEGRMLSGLARKTTLGFASSSETPPFAWRFS